MDGEIINTICVGGSHFFIRIVNSGSKNYFKKLIMFSNKNKNFKFKKLLGFQNFEKIKSNWFSIE
jgi:hypothetical protein